MPEINHRVGIRGSLHDVYTALTTDAGLSTWWTTDTKGAGPVGSIIEFRFNGGGPDFEVVELQPDRLVRWRHTGSMPEEWAGTGISFELTESNGQVFVRFRHSSWQEASDFLAHCSSKWGAFLLSLKDAIETGTGRPFPHDIHIDHSE
ncbi:MAG: SRPBCC domain-containing protein [Gammaproteobacteria bacterium]|nr:SRPBCC domain-containing protein [Gammaproteobacteria bacterium]